MTLPFLVGYATGAFSLLALLMLLPIERDRRRGRSSQRLYGQESRFHGRCQDFTPMTERS